MALPARACALLPSGLAAISAALLATARAGDHVLVTDSVYRPTRNFCNGVFKKFGVETTYYDPLIGADIAKLFKPNTRVVFVEAPGSQSFEMQDIPAIAKIAHDRERARADGQHLGDAALFPRLRKRRRLSKSRPAPNISAAIPTSCSAACRPMRRPCRH